MNGSVLEEQAAASGVPVCNSGCLVPVGKVAPDDPSGFVSLEEVVPEVVLALCYYNTYNFVGERIRGYEQPVALMSREAAQALRYASDAVKLDGYRLKIYDAYRPQMAVDHFAAWLRDLKDTRMKADFYPDLDKSMLIEQGYLTCRSGHSRGSSVDLTLFDVKAGMDVDMGGTFDYFGELSHVSCREKLTQQQYDNRMYLREKMEAAGFRPLEEEWWHFTLNNEPYPNTYFTFPVRWDILPGKGHPVKN